MRLSTSNKGWHLQWFYVKDDATAPLLVFSGRVIVEVLGSWKWGVPVKEKKNINDLLAALQTLKDRGMKGSGIIGAYHARRVVPLMARVLPLHQMAPGASFEGTVLVNEVLPPSKVAHRIKEVREPLKDTAGVILDFVFLVPGHPPIRPELGFIDFVSFLSPYSFFYLNFRPLEANLGMAGPAEGTFLQGKPGSVAEVSDPGESEPYCGRVGQKDEGAQEEGTATEAASTRSRRRDKQ